MNVYKTFLKPLLFSFDAEKVHNGVTFLGESLENVLLGRGEKLEKEVLGIKFANPIGLAAGFDYDGHLAKVIKAVADCLESFVTFQNKKYVSYFELNISCPNTAMSEGFTVLY